MMKKKITLITNICLEPYWKSCINNVFSCSSGGIFVDSIMLEDCYRCENFEDTVVVCLNFEQLYPHVSNDVLAGKVTYDAIEKDCIYKCRELYSYIKTHGNTRVIWIGFEDYYCLQSINYGSLFTLEGLVDRINWTLNDTFKDDVFIDLKRLIAILGIQKSYDAKGKYRWNAPYSKELIDLIVKEVYKQDLIAVGNTKKCLILDCDNVLWGGILSEDGIEGIKIGGSGIGRSFEDFQHYLLDLYYHGVILAVCSKNDETDVLRVFREHSGMLLKEEHIACFKCNWNNKAENINDINKYLNIGLDSIVFVDDSIFEIESVKSLLPHVKTILYNRDTIYDNLSCFNLKYGVDCNTVKSRTMTYKTNIQRVELQRNALSYESYISSLDMVIDIHQAKEHELYRISELSQRTNKCTNGARYTLDQIKKLYVDANYSIYTVSLTDKFLNLGIVGAMVIKGQCVELFCLSCRALGRHVETNMMDFLLKNDMSCVTFKEVNSVYSNDLIEAFRRQGFEIKKHSISKP